MTHNNILLFCLWKIITVLITFEGHADFPFKTSDYFVYFVLLNKKRFAVCVIFACIFLLNVDNFEMRPNSYSWQFFFYILRRHFHKPALINYSYYFANSTCAHTVQLLLYQKLFLSYVEIARQQFIVLNLTTLNDSSYNAICNNI